MRPQNAAAAASRINHRKLPLKAPLYIWLPVETAFLQTAAESGAIVPCQLGHAIPRPPSSHGSQQKKLYVCIQNDMFECSLTWILGIQIGEMGNRHPASLVSLRVTLYTLCIRLVILGDQSKQ